MRYIFLLLLNLPLFDAVMHEACASASPPSTPTSDSQPAAGEFRTGSDVATACALPRSDLRYFGCLGFVHGVLVGYTKAHGISYCNPKTGPFDEGTAVEAYAKQYPGSLSEPAARWIVEAALSSYPCHKP